MVNIRHVETRKSREREGEIEALVDIESESGRLDDVVRDLRKTFPRVTVYDDEKLHRAITKTVSLDKGGTKCEPWSGEEMARLRHVGQFKPNVDRMYRITIGLASNTATPDAKITDTGALTIKQFCIIHINIECNWRTHQY